MEDNYVYALILIDFENPNKSTVTTFNTQQLALDKLQEWYEDDLKNAYFTNVIMHGNSCYEYTNKFSNKRTMVVYNKSYVFDKL